ncbi:hypothetical protein [Cellulophaga sp. L1A9]|uniref:hypothetical protein n=1 Tax=Cellulophaga sp. L1A9 TaxID=2686362 RepID=UPI00131C0564|nr:hypothetical protein [Cellulophaga sp. L1A9]
MAFEALKKDHVDIEIDMRSYIETSEEFYKLKIFKILMGSVTMISQSLVLGAIVFLALLMVSFGIAFAINEAMGNFYAGFLILGAFYMLVALACYIFRTILNRPILRKFSKYYFDRT